MNALPALVKRHPMRSVALVLTCLTLAAFFLRAWHFSDWLHFELDQARDIQVVLPALENGPEELPLLGPRAAGTFLRLGPAFYDLQYVSGLLFGPTPAGTAALFMLLSAAFIPLLYCFLRTYFTKPVSLGLTGLAAVSLFLVVYGRFAWNPNPLPFFLVLGWWGLLKASREATLGRQTAWLMLSAFGWGVATQLHFLAFVTFPIILLLYLVFRRPPLRAKAVLFAAGVLALLYLPVVLNDLETGGANVKEFVAAVTEKSGESERRLPEKIVKAVGVTVNGYWMMLSGYQYAELPGLDLRGQGWNITCDWDCRRGVGWGVLAAVFLGLGFYRMLRRTFVLKAEQAGKKDFIVLMLIVQIVSAGLFISLAFDFSQRFLLLVAPLPFVFLGLAWETLRRFSRRSMEINLAVFGLGMIGLALLITHNLLAVAERFTEYRRAPYEFFEIESDRVLKERTRVTLEQQELVADHIARFRIENRWPVYLHAQSQHLRALSFLVEERGAAVRSADWKMERVYLEGWYFLVYRTQSDRDALVSRYLDRFDIAEERDFGTLTLYRLAPKDSAVTDIREVIQPAEVSNKPAPGVPARYTWKSWWSRQGAPADTEQEEPTDE